MQLFILKLWNLSMRKILIVAAFSLLPLTGFAEGTTHTTDTYASSVGRALVITAGVVGGIFLADYLIGASMIAPIAPMTHPDVQQARAAGAVFGQQIAAATAIRDTEAKVAMAYTLLVGSGAILGGLLVKWLFLDTAEPQSTTK